MRQKVEIRFPALHQMICCAARCHKAIFGKRRDWNFPPVYWYRNDEVLRKWTSKSGARASFTNIDHFSGWKYVIQNPVSPLSVIKNGNNLSWTRGKYFFYAKASNEQVLKNFMEAFPY